MKMVILWDIAPCSLLEIGIVSVSLFAFIIRTMGYSYNEEHIRCGGGGLDVSLTTK